MDLFKNVLGVFSTTDNSKVENLDEVLQLNNNMINNVVNDLLTPYLKDVKTEDFSFDKLNKMEYTLKLLDADVCADIAINLSGNLESKMKKFKTPELGDDILLGDIKQSCKKDNSCNKVLNEKNIDSSVGKISKKQLCDKLAFHYVKILNLVASILMAINPNNNLYLSRIENLYTLVDDNSAFEVNLCLNKKLSQNSLIKEPGMENLLQLYLFHLLLDTETTKDKEDVLAQYKKLEDLFVENRVVTLSNEMNKNNNEQENKTENIPANSQPESKPANNQPENKPANINQSENKPVNNQPENKPANNQPENKPVNNQPENKPANNEPKNNEPENKPVNNKLENTQNNVNNLRTMILGIRDRFNDLKESSKQNKNNLKSNIKRELKLEINDLKSTVGDLVKLVKEKKVTPTNVNKVVNKTNNNTQMYMNINKKSTNNLPNSNVNKKNNEPVNNTTNKISSKSTINLNNNSNKINKLSNNQSNVNLEYVKNRINSAMSKLNSSNNMLPNTNQNKNKTPELGNQNKTPELGNQNKTPELGNQVGGNDNLVEFQNFIKKYFKSDNSIVNKLLPVFNQKFVEANQEKVDRICTNAESQNKSFKIELSEASNNEDVKNFIKNYQLMKSEYLDSCKKLVDILEKKILSIQKPKDSNEEQKNNSVKNNENTKNVEKQLSNNNTVQKYQVNDLNSDELKGIEKEIRTLLGQLFAGGHRKYLDGVNHLDSYFFKKFNEKVTSD